MRLKDRKQFGRVKASVPDSSEPALIVEWLVPERRAERIPLADVSCGLQLGMEVQDIPRSRVRRPLGEGEVVELRELGSCEQALVDFPAAGIRAWLPYENLKQIRGVRHAFLRPRTPNAGEAERLRLRCLAQALELWNENTGALSHLDIDPLPHQIHLVHHILASGNLNWLIADDVGLGKTIEVGMLLAALEQRGGFRRILIVTPAGLTRQWQDELHYKFAMSDFQIYGVDFQVNNPRHWKLHDRVIGSIDLLKADAHKASLLSADPWDIVIFDEAHRLSRRQWGRKIEASDRFRLAADLRQCTDAMLLLSATPHQGMHDKFQAILELLRPELRNEIAMLALNPEILREMVIRNHKADVTDAEGRFIFQGKTTRAIPVEPSDDARDFDRELRRYLERGYAAGRRLGRQGIAIGFVMTVYRKLAASSAAAIHLALKRRLARLRDELAQQEYTDEAPDERFEGEWEEQYAGSEKEFFDGEIMMLEALIDKAGALVRSDRKVASFIDGLVGAVLNASPEEKILVFTEYRATQEFLAHALRARFGDERVSLIHGSQDQTTRAEEIEHFEDEGQFLISTEAGGEGINLQRRCHVMANFDLPWNPMRLVQRIGRLYRYGQDDRVVVFNVHAPQTLDAEIMDIMYERITQVVSDMAVLGDEYNENLAEDILGELADVIEVEEILQEAVSAGIERTRKRIDEALARARAAVEKQRELFEHVSGYDPGEAKRELAITGAHVRAFVTGMFAHLGVEIVETRHGGLVWDIRLPESVAGEMSSRRTRWRVTLDRTWGAARSDIHMLDLESPLMRFMLRYAKAYEFGGRTAGIAHLPGVALTAAVLRWQNEQGRRMRQEFAIVRMIGDSAAEMNPTEVTDWLTGPAQDGADLPAESNTERWLHAAQQAVDRRLAEMSNADLHPENRQWIAAAWRGESAMRGNRADSGATAS